MEERFSLITNDINQALNSSDQTERLDYLNAAKEKLLHFPERDNDLFLPHYRELCSVGLLMDTNVEVRKFALGFAKEAILGSKSLHVVLVCIAAFVFVVSNNTSPVEVMRRVMTLLLSGTWEACFLVLIKLKSNNKEKCQELYDSLWKLKAFICTSIINVPSYDESCRVNGIKFLQMVCEYFFSDYNIQTMAGGGGGGNTSSNSSSGGASSIGNSNNTRISDIIRSHPILTMVGLESEGLQHVNLLGEVLQNPKSPKPSIQTTVINVMFLLAKTRVNVRDIIITRFISVNHAKYLLPNAAQTLKTKMFELLKAIVSTAASTHIAEPSTQALIKELTQNLGMNDQVKKLIDPIENKRKHEMRKQEEIKQKLKNYPGQKNQFDTDNLMFLPIETLVNLIIENSKNVPDPPPGHVRPSNSSSSSSSSNNNNNNNNSSSDATTLLPLKFDRFINLVKAVETGTREIKLPQMMLKTEASYGREKMEEVEVLQQMYMAAFERVAKSTLRSGQSFAKTGGAGWETRTLELCAVLMTRLACGNVMEEEDETGGGGAMRNKLLRDFLFQPMLTSNELFTSVAIAALHLEFIAQVNDATNAARYEKFLMLVLESLHQLQDVPATIKVRLNEVLKQAPSVPTSAILFLIDSFCYAESDKINIGLSALNQLFISRPTCREMVLDLFLLFAYDGDASRKKLRETTIKLLSNRIWAFLVASHSTALTKKIMDYSFEMFKSLSNVGDAAAAAKNQCEIDLLHLIEKHYTAGGAKRVKLEPPPPMDEQHEVSRRSFLFIALCANDPNLMFPLLLEGYCVLSHHHKLLTSLQTTCVEAFAKIAKERTTQEAFSLLQFFPTQAKELVLLAIKCFAERDPDAALLPLKMLKSREASQVNCWDVDVRFVLPVIGCLQREEVLATMSRIGAQLYSDGAATAANKLKDELADEVTKRAIANIVKGSVGCTLDFADLLVQCSFLEKVKLAVRCTDELLQNKAIMNAKVADNALNLLLSSPTVLPNICMRVVVRIKNDYARELKPSILHFLNGVVGRRSGELRSNVGIWQGFCICMKDLKPDSFAIILKLPMDLLRRFLSGADTNFKEEEVKQFKTFLKNAVANDPNLLQLRFEKEEDKKVDQKAEEKDPQQEEEEEEKKSRLSEIQEIKSLLEVIK